MSNIERALREIHRDARALKMGEDDVAGVMGRLRARPPRRRRARWLLVLVPVALIAAGATWVATRPSTEALATTGIACAATTEEEPNIAVVSGQGRDPLAVCAELWRHGAIDRTTRDVPPLTACGGAGLRNSVTVYPTGDAGVCGHYGLPPLPADFMAVSARLAGLQRIAESPGCRSVPEARALVEAELARIGAGDWTTTVRRLDDPAPCVAVTIDGDRREVAILQLARPPAPSPGVRARDRAWAAVLAAFRAASPGWPERGCPDPGATLATVRSAVHGTALADVPIVVQSGTDVPGVAFNATLRCADLSLSLTSGESAEFIALVPEVPAKALYPTEERLRALAAGPNETLGLPFAPGP